MVETTQAERQRRIIAQVINPLVEKGMRKPKSRTRTEQQEWERRLAEDLAWLEPKWFDTLIEQIEGMAEGKRGDTWPSRLVIVKHARRLSRWAGTPKLVASYMRSIEGRRAWRRSPVHAHVLCRFLEQNRRPPSEADLAHIWLRADAMLEQVKKARRDVDDPQHGGEAREFLGRYRERRLYLARLIWGRMNEGAEDDGAANQGRTGEGRLARHKVEAAA